MKNWIKRFWKPRTKTLKFGEAFILEVGGRRLAMVVTSVNMTMNNPTYGTIATLDHFMMKGDSRG